MRGKSHYHGWEQHFPTYHSKDRDILLEEYRTSAETFKSEENIFLKATNLTIIIATALASLILGTLKGLTKTLDGLVPSFIILLLLIFLTAVFSYLTLRYFADRQKAIAYAARKMVVLRRMLGLDYGPFHLVMPNWRIEGANEPFGIRLFPSWNTYVAYPCYIIGLISAATMLYFELQLIANHNVLNVPELATAGAFSLLWVIFLSISYRKALLDTHEKLIQIWSCFILKKFGLSFESNFEYVIYRSILAKYEYTRLGISLERLKVFLVFIEDRQFFKHHGISLRALLRAFLSQLGLINPRSGGSTITQQLVRTLFIVDHSKKVRRKIAELTLAPWFNSEFGKNEQLELYLASVRFEYGVYGVIAAMIHYWDKLTKSPSPAQAFFLIERVSNIKSGFLCNKIIQTVKFAIKQNILDSDDAEELFHLYKQAIERGKIKDDKNMIASMAKYIESLQTAKCQ